MTTDVTTNRVPPPQMHTPTPPQTRFPDYIQQMMTSPGIYAVEGGSVYRLEDTQGTWMSNTTIPGINQVYSSVNTSSKGGPSTCTPTHYKSINKTELV